MSYAEVLHKIYLGWVWELYCRKHTSSYKLFITLALLWPGLWNNSILNGEFLMYFTALQFKYSASVKY